MHSPYIAFGVGNALSVNPEIRHADNGDLLLALVNFSEHQQMVDGRILQMFAYGDVFDLLTGTYVLETQLTHTRNDFTLNGYQVMWLVSGK